MMQLDSAFWFKQIRWSWIEGVRSWGRNGFVQQTGVEVYANTTGDAERHRVELSPITTKNDVSRAVIVSVPFESKALRELADHFALLATQALAFETEERMKQFVEQRAP